MDCVHETAEGVVLVVKAAPRGRTNQLRGVQHGALKVSVTAPPEKGKANQALHALLCRVLGLRPRQLELTDGIGSSRKRFLVREVTREELEQRLHAVLVSCGNREGPLGG